MKESAQRFIASVFLLVCICLGIFVWITYSNMQLTLQESQQVSKALKSLQRSQLPDSIRPNVLPAETIDPAILHQSDTQRLQNVRHPYLLFFSLSSIFFIGLIAAYFITRKYLHRQQVYQAKLSYVSALVEQTSETFFSTDPGFIVKSWNNAAERMYGFTSEEAIGKKLDTLFTIQQDDPHYSILSDHLQKHGFYKGEFQVCCNDGHLIFVESSVTVLRNKDQEIYGYAAIHRDITERMKLQEKLDQRNSAPEEKVAAKAVELNPVFERITDGFVALDHNWNYTYVNKRACEMMGLEPQAVMGKNVFDIFQVGSDSRFYIYCHKAFDEQQYHYLEEYYAPLGMWIENHIYPSPDGLTIVFHDITQKKLAEQVLKESEGKYRSLVELSPDAILINQVNQIQYANPAALTIFGAHSEDELLGKYYSDLFDPHVTVDRQTANGEPSSVLEERIVRLDGKVMDVEVVATSFHYLGTPATQVVLRPLTERKEVEKKLRQSDQIFNQSVDLLCTAGLDGYFKSLNPAWTKTLGWTLSELLSKPWIEFVHPEDQEKSGSLEMIFSAREESLHFENRFLCKDGTYKWIAWNSFIYPSEEIIFGVGRDITANKKYEDELFKSNQLFKNLAQLSPVGIFRADIEGDCLYVNERWCTMAGMSAEEAMGSGWLKSIHPDDVTRVFEQWYKLEKGDPGFKMEYRFMKPNGSETWVMGQAKAELDHNEKIIGYVGSITDISEIKQAEKLINYTADGLKKSQQYAHLANWTWNIPWGKFEWSDEMYNILGVSSDTFEGKKETFFSLIREHVDQFKIESALGNHMNGPLPRPFEFNITLQDGLVHTIYTEIAELKTDKKGLPFELSGIVQDITQRKEAEQEILKATRLYEFISQVNQLMLRAKDAETIYQEVCRIAIQCGRFRMAWIGLLQVNEHLIKPVAWDGFEEGYLTVISPYFIDHISNLNLPTGKAIREKKYFYCNDIERDPTFAQWRHEQLQRGYRSVVALPIYVEEEVIGVFTIYAAQAQFFIPSEIQLLEEVTRNIGYALENIERDKKRKAAEEGLRKLFTAVEQSSASIVITDIEGNIEYVNPAFTRISGYTFEESIGRNTRMLKSGVSDEQVYRQLWANIKSSREWNGIFCNKKKSGELYWESATISPIQNEAGEITNYVAVKENITDKIKAEEQLVKEKELSDSIINSLPGIFYLFDASGKFLRWNNNFETVSGYTAEEIATMHPVDFYDRDEQPMFRQRITKVLAGENVHGSETLFFTKSKKKIPYYCNTLSIFYEGGPCILGTGTDVTDRKAAEEENRKLAMIASLTSNSIILTDDRGDIQWVNNGFERILKYALEEVIGKKPSSILNGPETDPQVTRKIEDCILQRTSFKVEMVNYSKTGEKYWLEMEGVPLLNEQHDFIGYLGIQQDITERKNTEKELLVLNQHLNERAKALIVSNKELERFAYVASHDLQEPLRMVSSFMLLLKRNYDTQLDARANQYINFAVDGTERMKQLIMDLLEYSRVGTSKEVFVMTDLNDVLKEVIAVFVKPPEEQGPQIHAVSLPQIVANRSQMVQLFQNLVGNAIKYRSESAAEVHINYEEQAEHYLFSVTDNGIGIAPIHFERIFMLFQRLHLKTEFTGTGIGLTICKKIVEKHGGTIWLKSEPGKGSTFYFTIKKNL